MFIDQARIFVRAGSGGSGACSFRREKFVPYGGPDGGDGGDGGDIIFRASTRVTTLLDLKYRRHYEAQSGQPGHGSNKHGRSGSPTVITVPVGTIIRDDQTHETLADLTRDGETSIIAPGGQGGRGNARFATSTNRAPRQHEPGTPGEARWLRLELRLLADVGLVGFPNAGKSTFISALSAARPEIAGYPFTTLRPFLGVVPLNDLESFVVADIPGLIEGAHEGKGLGFQFLRHIQRTRFLLFLIDISEWVPEDPVQSFQVLQRELATFDAVLQQRPFAVVGTKLDIQGNGENLTKLREFCETQEVPFFTVSAVTHTGLEPVVNYLGLQLKQEKILCENNC